MRLGATLVHCIFLACDSLSIHFLDLPVLEIAVLRHCFVGLESILLGRVRTYHHVVLADVSAGLLRLGGLF